MSRTVSRDERQRALQLSFRADRFIFIITCQGALHVQWHGVCRGSWQTDKIICDYFVGGRCLRTQPTPKLKISRCRRQLSRLPIIVRIISFFLSTDTAVDVNQTALLYFRDILCFFHVFALLIWFSNLFFLVQKKRQCSFFHLGLVAWKKNLLFSVQQSDEAVCFNKF